ncbi:probable transcriptional regulator SLK2 isoform X2 [Tanacetum coccineum]
MTSPGAGSLVTKANSGLSGGTPSLKRSASMNTDSYMRLPASPLSFNSNNISISGSSVIDGQSTPVQQQQVVREVLVLYRVYNTAATVNDPALAAIP